jgi:excisionase family DNA binding protein
MQQTMTMTPAEFARAAGLTLPYVYSLLWAGRLPAEKSVEGTWRIDASALEQRRQQKAVTA